MANTGPAPAAGPANFTKVVSAVTFYWIVSISLVFLNKLVMSGDLDLDAPLFLTWTQIVAAVLCCYVFSTLKKNGVEAFNFFPDFEYKLDIAYKVLPLTLVFLGMIIFNNLCLKYVAVSFYQVARSLTIVFNIVLTYFELGQTTSYRCMGAVGVVVFGYLIGCDGELNFSWAGVLYGVSASFFVAWYSIYVKKTEKFVNGNSWLMLIYNNMNAMFVLPIISLFVGDGSIVYNSTVYYEMGFWVVIVLTGLAGFLINIATFIQIEATTPLTHNVSGTAKAAAQTILAVIVFGNPMTFFGAFGCFLTLVGSLLYAYIRRKEAEIEKARKAAQGGTDVEYGKVPKEEPRGAYDDESATDKGEKA